MLLSLTINFLTFKLHTNLYCNKKILSIITSVISYTNLVCFKKNKGIVTQTDVYFYATIWKVKYYFLSFKRHLFIQNNNIPVSCL